MPIQALGEEGHSVTEPCYNSEAQVEAEPTLEIVTRMRVSEERVGVSESEGGGHLKPSTL